MIQKQQIGLSNWHKAGSERAEQYVNSAEYEAHTDEQRKLIFKDIDEEVVGNGFLFDNSLIDFEELPFKSADEDEIFDGLYLKMKVSLKEIYFNLNNENYHYSKDQFVDAIKIIK